LGGQAEKLEWGEGEFDAADKQGIHFAGDRAVLCVLEFSIFMIDLLPSVSLHNGALMRIPSDGRRRGLCPPPSLGEVENAGKLAAAACRRATTWRPESFLRCRGLGRMSRRNGCTVRILQGARGPYGRSGNQQRKSDARTVAAKPMPCWPLKATTGWLGRSQCRDRRRWRAGLATRDRKPGKERPRNCTSPHLPLLHAARSFKPKNANSRCLGSEQAVITSGISNATMRRPFDVRGEQSLPRAPLGVIFPVAPRSSTSVRTCRPTRGERRIATLMRTLFGKVYGEPGESEAGKSRRGKGRIHMFAWPRGRCTRCTDRPVN
jgi:hypothetical protein